MELSILCFCFLFITQKFVFEMVFFTRIKNFPREDQQGSMGLRTSLGRIKAFYHTETRCVKRLFVRVKKLVVI